MRRRRRERSRLGAQLSSTEVEESAVLFQSSNDPHNVGVRDAVVVDEGGNGGEGHEILAGFCCCVARR